MSSRNGRGPLAPLTGPPPLLQDISRRMREARVEFLKPPLPPVGWGDLVEDPALHRYIGGVWERFGEFGAVIHETTVWSAMRDKGAPDLDGARLCDYLPIRPLSTLAVDLIRYRRDRTERRVLRPQWVRAVLLEGLFAALDTALMPPDEDEEDEEGEPDLRHNLRFAHAAMHGRYSMRDGGIHFAWDSQSGAMDEASKLVCGAAKCELDRDFRRACPDLVDAERAAQKQRDLRRGDPFSAPHHFLRWVWANRRQATLDDLAPYGLDEVHWQFLTCDAADSPRQVR